MFFTKQRVSRILALYPSTYGYGYAVFEGRNELIASGIKRINRDVNRITLRGMTTMISEYKPDVVVIEDYAGKGSQRSKRIQHLFESVVGFAHMKRITTRAYSRALIQEAFSKAGAVTKQEIATAIAYEFPELAPRLPAKRKIWRPENPRLHMFDAVSLALTYYFFEVAKENSHAA